ncbi:MAG: ATP-binding protein [Burkholderiales bacterium]|nr:ATP-binding protein [Burkholderiales bacterium]
MTYVLIASAVAGGILLFLLAAASGNTALFAKHYPLLLGLNVAIAPALVGPVGYQLYALVRARRARVFGSRLTLRFVGFFALMALVPGALVYTVSVSFLTRSIESWFDVRVDRALESGLDLGREALDGRLADLAANATLFAGELADAPAASVPLLLDRVRERAGAAEALLVTASGAVVASASRDFGKLVAEAPSATLLRQARQARGYRRVESEGERGLRLRVIVPLPAVSLTGETRFLQLVQPVPASLAANAESVQAAYRDYKELALARQGLRQIYLLTLTLTLLFALFTAMALAFILSRRLSEPLAELAQGTQAVARGDFSRRAPVRSADELGILTRSFNAMTGQLDEARRAADASRAAVENARARLENILANLSAGVLVLDAGLRLEHANAGAAAILREDLSPLVGRRLDEWTVEEEFARAVSAGFDAHGEAEWQRELEAADGAQVLLLRGSTLPAAAGGGRIVVFDDVTQLVAAQRATAWAEVARRLAHEIKNPLTPIQLSAERIAAKLGPKLDAADAAALERATNTIVDQVAALKNMVDEFKEYARLPAPAFTPLDLNRVVTEVLALYEHGHAHAPIRVRLGEGLPPVRGDAGQLRQVIHNLLQNAQDALAGSADPAIELVTERAGDRVWLRVLDNGSGFAEATMKRAFEPYVTTKPKGTGLGLAIVKKIIDEHHGTVRIENRAERGAAVSIALPLARAA